MIITLGKSESDAVSINVLQICYWRVLKNREGEDIYQLVFPGQTELTLTRDESLAFGQFMKQKAEPQRIQPASAILAPY